MGISHLILELDSSSAVSLIKHLIDNRYPYSSLILKIKLLLDQSWDVKVEYIYCEANHAADFMASLGHNLAFDLHVYCSSSDGLDSFLSNDSRGVTLPRLIV